MPLEVGTVSTEVFRRAWLYWHCQVAMPLEVGTVSTIFSLSSRSSGSGRRNALRSRDSFNDLHRAGCKSNLEAVAMPLEVGTVSTHVGSTIQAPNPRVAMPLEVGTVSTTGFIKKL